MSNDVALRLAKQALRNCPFRAYDPRLMLSGPFRFLFALLRLWIEDSQQNQELASPAHWSAPMRFATIILSLNLIGSTRLLLRLGYPGELTAPIFVPPLKPP
jgi:hypothetical protein